MSAYEDYLDGLQKRTQRQQMLESNLGEAANTNPDEFAHMVKLSRAAQVSVDAVPEYKDIANQAKLIRDVNAPTMFDQAPKTSNFLLDPTKAKIVGDDINSLKDMEARFGTIKPIERTWWESISEPFTRGYRQFEKIWAQTVHETGIWSGVDKRIAEAKAAHGMEHDPRLDYANSMAQLERRIQALPVPEDIQTGMSEISNAKTFGEAFNAIRRNPQAVGEITLQSAGTFAPVLAVAAASSVVGPEGPSTVIPFLTQQAIRRGATTFAGSALVEYGSTIDQVMQETGADMKDPLSVYKVLSDEKLMSDAREKAVKRGVAVGLFDALTATLAGKLLSGAKPTVGSVAGRVAGEVGLQAGGGAAGEATAQAVTGEFKPGDILMEAIAELPTAAIEIPGNYRSTMDQAVRVEKITQVVEELNQLSAANKTRTRDIDTFKEFIDQATEDGPVQNVYVSADVLRQSGMANELAKLSPVVAAQIEGALATNGEVQIPIAEYMANIAPTNVSAAIIDDLRVEGETMTRREAREFIERKSEELQAAMDQAIQKQQTDDVFAKSARAVEQRMFDQIKGTGVYSAAASRNFAAYVRDIYVTKAAQMNMTPEELFDLVPYTVTSEMPAPEVKLFNQDNTVITDSPAFAAFYRNSVFRDEQGKAQVLYHGTADDVTQFDVNHPNRKDTGWLGTGVYLTDSADMADLYAGQKKRTGEAAPNVMPLYARLENPYMATAEDKARVRAGGRAAADQFTADLIAQGYDGVIYQAAPDAREIVVFDPAAVKSQFNDGTWSDAQDLLRQGELKRGDVAQHQLLVERQARATGQAARFTDAERAAVDKAAKEAKVSRAEIERQVREHKLAHPPKDGWAPLEFTGVTVDDNGGYELKYKAIPYGFDEDANGKTLKKGSKEWDKRTSAIAKRIRDEVLTVYERAKAGDKNAANIIRQAGWYREMRTRLRQEFGGLGDLFADLLGATSPNTPVRGNWENAVDLLRRASRGDFDELMPKWVQWSQKLDAAETEFAAWFGSQVEAGMSKKAIKQSPEYTERYARVAELRKLPDSLLPQKESGKLYGFNGKNAVRAMLNLWRVVRDPNADIGIGGTAPKALNFSGNLIGFRERATIDVWAARLLQRLAGKLRIPSMAEGSVSGKMLSTGETTLTFGFGQDVFQKAVKDIRNDPQMKGDKLLSSVNDDDLQAIVWFLEKEVWTKNNWTTAAGEGGSFEYEADLTGQRDQARIRELRRIADSSASATEQQKEDAQAETDRLNEQKADLRAQRDEAKKAGNKRLVNDLTKQVKEIDKALGRQKRVLDAPSPEIVRQRREEALAELNTLTRAVDRFQGGLSIQQSAETQGIDFVPSDADMARLGEDIKTSVYEADDGATVLGSKVLSTEGRYGAPERSLDLEVVTRAGFNPLPMWLKMLEAAKAANQDSTFLSRVLRHDEKVDFQRHRPGVEIYFREAGAIDKLQPILDDLAKQGIEFYTVIVDGKRSPEAMAGEMPPAVGVRFQYVPEMNARYGLDDFNWADLTVEEISTKMKEQASALNNLAATVAAGVEGVSFAGQFWYETEVAFKNQYQEKIDDITSRVAEGKRGEAGAGAWAGQSVREGVEAADRWARESERESAGAGAVQPGGELLKQSGTGAGGQGGGGTLRVADLGITQRYGVARDGATRVTGVHYSREPRSTLAGAFYGTGLKGAEAGRLAGSGDRRLNQRIHFYVDEGSGVRPEAGVGTNVHGVILENLYDVAADPLGLRKQAAQMGIDDKGLWFNAVESAILEAGYDGVYVPGAQGNQGVAVLLGNHAVQVEQKGTHAMAGAGGYVAPSTGKRRYSLLSSEIRKFEAERAAIEEAAPSVKLKDGSITFDEGDTEAIAQFFPPAARAGQLRQEMRGGFDPKRLNTVLTEQSDYSTFVHETAHFYLTALFRMAELPNATQQMKDDVQTVLDWFGIESLEAWNAMSLEEQRKYHERWAYNHEIYVFEGKAPSIKMQTLFDQFSAWLRRVYKSIRDELNTIYRQEHGEDLPILTGEVRQVMDRMLASDEQIRQAETVRGMVPLYQSQEESGMSDAEWAAYQAMMKESTDASIAELTNASLRQMRWMSNARSKLLKEMQKQTAEIRKDVRAQVTKEIEQEPIYRAIRWLKYGEMTTPEGEEIKVTAGNKLKLEDVKAMYPENRAGIQDVPDFQKLGYGQYGMLAAEGLNPDLAADMFGFTSGDQLVRTLLDTPSLKEAIDTRTDQRMLEEYGDMSDPKQMNLAVERALHNEARARFVAVELRHAAKATAPVRVMLEAARQAARRIVENKLVRDTKASEYSAAETRALKQAEAAMKKGDSQAVTQALQNRLLNNQLTAEAAKATQEIEKGLRYFRKVQTDKSRQRIGADYSDQIDQLLERFELRPIPLKEIDRRTSLAAWLEAQRNAGYEPEIAPELEQEVTRKSYKNMTVAEFRDLVDAVKQIEHLGRTQQNMLTAAKQVAYQEARDQIVDSINANAGGRIADARTPTTELGRYAQSLKRFWASHIKAATVARILDGGKDGGAMWEYFVRSANERGDMETEMRAKATEALTKIMQPIFDTGKMGGKGQFFPTLGRSLNKESQIAIALNMGNEGNIQRLLGGEGWTMEQVMPVLQSLTKRELQAVQQIWDYFETYRPMIAEKERRIYGKEPKWVEPKPLQVTSADGEVVNMRGGYYPIKYDPLASMRAESFADAEEAKRQMQGAFTSSTTRRSFTKSRVEEVKGRPLLYTLSGMYSGINDVIHDLAWHEWLIDANKLMRSQQIDEAIRNQYGPEFKDQLKTWINDVAAGERMATNSGEVALGRLRQGISAAGLGFNVLSAVQQITGFNQSIVRVGVKYIGRGITKTISSPMLAMKEVNEKSSFMANRARTQFRELNELRNMVQDESPAMRAVKMGAYFMMMRMQRMVDVPTWWGAYEKAIGEGNDEKRAIALADQAVIDSQGGGMVKDLSAIERGGPALKLFTVYYSYMNTVFNMAAAQTMTAKSKGKLAADYLMLFVVPVVLTSMLKGALVPSGDDDEWDWEKIARKLAAEQLSYLMGTMIVVREFGEAAKVVTGAEGGARDYSGPAGLRIVADGYKFLKQAGQGEFDDAFRKAAINLIGDFTGLPSAQINRTITGANALAEGETSNPAAVVLGYTKD